MFKTVALLFIKTNIAQEKDFFKPCTFLINELKSINYEVEKISVINENVGVVTYELSFLSRQYDIVLVIGDIRNDVIFKALGNVCYEELVKNPKFPNITNGCNGSYDYNLLPAAAKFLTLENSTYPIVYLQRIFILHEDYVEMLFSKLLKKHIEQYCLQQKFIKKYNVNDILVDMDKIKNLSAISITKGINCLTLTIEDTNFDHFIECEKVVKKKFHNIEEVYNNNNSILYNIYRSQEEHLQQAINDIVKCFETYGPENVFLSFNGGKDCTVLLHLVFIVMKIKYPGYNKPIFCMFVRNEDVFSEQDKFVEYCQIYYNLEIFVSSLNMKQALDNVLQTKPNLQACLMGTRHTDPYSSNLNTFQLTDPSWPRIMRVSPLLKWHYTDIWDYLLFYKVPYCELYNLGYTSLGNASNTVKNSSLYFYDVKLGKHIYLPAFKMLNEAEERTGRDTLR